MSSVIELPRGTVTFLFTDIEGSTRLLQELGDHYVEALAEHRRLLRESFSLHGGVEVDTQGDAFFVAFASASDAVVAAHEAKEALAGGPIRVRMGLHTGQPVVTEEGYVGLDVHAGARVAACAHGGQILLSRRTRDLAGDGFFFRDLGEHRLKDLAEPLWLFQLGEGQFPPLKTLSNSNLPTPASSFLGRAKELEQARELFAGTRLLTIAGPGGQGKTRFAIELASGQLEHFPNGVFWVPLASLRNPALVLEQAAQAIGAKDDLAAHIADGRMLLLLDNFEHVIEAAPRLSELLRACSNLSLLITSRETLRLEGETEYILPPLAEEEGVELFCARASAVPSEASRELCRRLDCLPLAIELAAARAKLLSPEQLLARLSERLDLLKGGRDAGARHATLRATIGWSYDLLLPEEKRLFARLAVFAAGCTLESGEEVCEADLDTLESLVDKSLIRHTGERFWMLETIREYALDELDDLGEAEELRRRHAAYFLLLCEESKRKLEGGREQVVWLERLEQERDNLRASLAWAREADVELGLRLAVALVGFWDIRGPIGEARAWLSTLLERANEETLELQAEVLPWACDYARVQGDYDEAHALGEESLRLARQFGDPMAIARALHDLAELAVERGEYERAQGLYEAAIATASEVGYPGTGSLLNLGDLALIQHDYERADELSRRALAQLREQGKYQHESIALSNLAQVELRRGRYAESLSRLEEGLALTQRLGYDEGSAAFLQTLAALLAAQGRPREAARMLAASETALETLGIRLGPTEQYTRESAIQAVEALLSDEAYAQAAASGRSMNIDEAIAHGLPIARAGALL
jgi:predicted ATPase/class 3 adenylate cyclase/Tfp pilus assembly protein PilF